MNLAKLSLLISCFLGIVGCSHHYTPKPDRPFEAITEFSSTNALTLLNGQTSTAPTEFFRADVGGGFSGNFNEWTDVAISITKRELEKRGMQVVNGLPKTLTLAVTSARTQGGIQGSWGIESNIVMRAETSDGYSATYTGRNRSQVAANIPRQIDGALMRVVVELLKDPQIVAFLTK